MKRLIVVAGPSGSGKSTAAAQCGLPVLELDAFYRDRSVRDMPRWLGDVDWEHVDAFDLDAAVTAVGALVRGETVELAAHDLVSERTNTVRTWRAEGRCLVIEGVMALVVVRRLDAPPDAIFFVRRSVALNVVTRIVRDVGGRGRSPWRAVLRSLHVAWQEPGQRRAARELGAAVVTRRGLRESLASERDERCCERGTSM
jgi:uridine kinase